MDIKEKKIIITRNLQEIIGEKDFENLLSKKEVSVYWGTMPTGSIHISYLLPFIKLRDFLSVGWKVKILIADLHAALDGIPWKILKKRQQYYEAVIPEMIKCLGINPKKLEFITGSKIQLKPKYFEDVLKMSMVTTLKDNTKAASEVVKLSDNPKLGNLIYPIMQSLDEEYLNVDAQFGGLDQRKILVFARENLPKLGYKPRVELMNPIISGLIGKKMSASIPGSKIDLLDDEKTISNKIRKADCIAGDSKNGLMEFLKYVIFPIKETKKEAFKIERKKEYGGPLIYKNYKDLEKDFISKKLHPLDVKNSLAKEINKLIEPIRKNSKIQKLYKEAYS